MLIANHLRIQEMVRLDLGHAQMRLPYDHLVEALKSRTPRRGDQGAVEVDVGLDQFGDLVGIPDRGPETLQRLERAGRHVTPFGQKACYGALDNTTGQIEIGNVGRIQERHAGGLVAHTSEQSGLYELLDCRLCGGPRDIEHLRNRHLGKCRSRWNGASQDLALHLRAKGIDDGSGF